MASLNKVLLIGNLTRDPELRYLTGGNSAVCEFGIAINRRFMQNGGQEKEETCFLELRITGQVADQKHFVQASGHAVLHARSERSLPGEDDERLRFLPRGAERDDRLAQEGAVHRHVAR